MGYYDSLYKLNYNSSKRENIQERNFINHGILPQLDLVTLFLFLKKLESYEPGIYQTIKNLIGVPKMIKGSMFRFTNQYTMNLYKVITVSPLNSYEKIYQTNQKKQNYKYGYTLEGYNGMQMLNYIYDSYIDAGYIIILG